MRCRELIVLLGLVACKEDEGTEDFLGSDTSGKAVGSAGGFAAAFGNDLKGGSGAGSAMTGSAMPGSAMTGSGGSGKPATGSGATAMTGSATTGSAATSTGSAMAGSAAKSGSGSAAGSAATSAVAAGSGSAKPTTPPTTAGSAVVVAPPIVRAHKPVTPSPEIAAIKLTLAPKWERDVDEAATFMRTVDIVSREFTFVFRYGYEDSAAPSDRPAYMKWLAEKKILLPASADKPLLNRQTGAAWYLEGVDGTGAPAFRYLVNYGDKKLICHGPLYKDTGLGDIRDDAIVQAKAICQSISL